MKQSLLLANLAFSLCEMIPDTADTLKQYVSDLAKFHLGESDLPTRPSEIPFFCQAFSNALQAIEMGWSSRVDYHLDRVKKSCSDSGVFVECKRVTRAFVDIPQPTDRKHFESARVPWDGKK